MACCNAPIVEDECDFTISVRPDGSPWKITEYQVCLNCNKTWTIHWHLERVLRETIYDDPIS
jgi:hypothetical protein